MIVHNEARIGFPLATFANDHSSPQAALPTCMCCAIRTLAVCLRSIGAAAPLSMLPLSEVKASSSHEGGVRWEVIAIRATASLEVTKWFGLVTADVPLAALLSREPRPAPPFRPEVGSAAGAGPRPLPASDVVLTPPTPGVVLWCGDETMMDTIPAAAARPSASEGLPRAPSDGKLELTDLLVLSMPFPGPPLSRCPFCTADSSLPSERRRLTTQTTAREARISAPITDPAITPPI